jgi:hypothetical protein
MYVLRSIIAYIAVDKGRHKTQNFVGAPWGATAVTGLDEIHLPAAVRNNMPIETARLNINIYFYQLPSQHNSVNGIKIYDLYIPIDDSHHFTRMKFIR